MGVQVRVLQKGKITIPVKLRNRLALEVGDTLSLQVRGGNLILVPGRTVENPTDLLSGLAEGVRVGKVTDEVRKAGAARLDRKLSRSSG